MPKQLRSATVPPIEPGRADCCSDGCSCAADVQRVVMSPTWQKAKRQAIALAWLSLLWMGLEGFFGLFAGIRSGSLSLTGWALGSVIEAAASVIVIWRFTGPRALSPASEARAQKAVAVSFLLLAPYLVIQGLRDLLVDHRDDATLVGIVVTTVSLLGMPALALAKTRLGRTLGSGATTGEGLQNLLCAAQAGAVLIGLATTAAFGWYWIDPIIAIVLGLWAIREGTKAWRGDGCC